MFNLLFYIDTYLLPLIIEIYFFFIMLDVCEVQKLTPRLKMMVKDKGTRNTLNVTKQRKSVSTSPQKMVPK